MFSGLECFSCSMRYLASQLSDYCSNSRALFLGKIDSCYHMNSSELLKFTRTYLLNNMGVNKPANSFNFYAEDL